VDGQVQVSYSLPVMLQFNHLTFLYLLILMWPMSIMSPFLSLFFSVIQYVLIVCLVILFVCKVHPQRFGRQKCTCGRKPSSKNRRFWPLAWWGGVCQKDHGED